VRIFDYGLVDDTPYIVMELLQGEALSVRLKRQGRLDAIETMRVVDHVGRALTRAHRVGIVHRDLKPANVFVVNDPIDGEICKVVDFGVAKQQGLNLTQTGTLMGTPAYMSPEQAVGSSAVDFRSDLWALGILAFRCLVGSNPFPQRETMEVLLNIVQGEMPVPSKVKPGIPPGFDAWWARACARAPDARFAGAMDQVEALREALEGRPASPMPVQVAWPAATFTAIPVTSPVTVPVGAPLSAPVTVPVGPPVTVPVSIVTDCVPVTVPAAPAMNVPAHTVLSATVESTEIPAAPTLANGPPAKTVEWAPLPSASATESTLRPASTTAVTPEPRPRWQLAAIVIAMVVVGGAGLLVVFRGGAKEVDTGAAQQDESAAGDLDAPSRAADPTAAPAATRDAEPLASASSSVSAPTGETAPRTPAPERPRPSFAAPRQPQAQPSPAQPKDRVGF
jgi:serine/threonine-protein kinase